MMPDTLNHVKPVSDTIKVDTAEVSTFSSVPENLKTDTTETSSSSDMPAQRQTKPADEYAMRIEIPDSNHIAPQATFKRMPVRPEIDSTAVEPANTQIFDKICWHPELEIKPIIEPYATSITDHNITPLKQLRQVAPFEIYGRESISPHAWSENVLVYKSADYENYSSRKGVAVISLFFVFVLLLVFSGRHLPDMFRAGYTYRLSGKRYSENYKSDARSGMYFTFFCGLILPFFLFTYLCSCGLFDYDYRYLALTYPALIGVWLLQSAATRICSAVARAELLVGEINFNKHLMAGIAGIALFPVVVTLLLYDDQELRETILNVGVAILILMIICTVIRMFVIFSSARVSAFRFFLYLCAFEISPYLALYIVFK